ncbi:unnamed protein product [Mytilus coruscus]|uniref:G-protein coupled receptors family 2 profile 2 domain-containing protein n=1 Tax=Mytilus coruscus TaxID=42192 RepID=A0A6J8ECB9_MYTCO|nr:unnamed protein product [Mytilus coruscus]
MILVLLLLNDWRCRGELSLSREYPATSDYKEVDYLTQNISNHEEKTIIEHQLLYCPRKSLCGGLARLQLPSNSSTSHISCCDQCSCSYDAQEEEHCPNIDIPITSTLRTSKHSYYMFANCATDFIDSDIINKCTSDQRHVDLFDINLFVPVSPINKTIVYKNIYCALCNNERESNIESWEAYVFCNNGTPFMQTPSNYKELLQEVQSSQMCKIRFSHRSRGFEKCNWGEYTRCNQTGYWTNYSMAIDHACNNYTSVYMGQYRNVFCYMCNTDRPPKMGCTNLDFWKGTGGYTFGSFTGLIRLRKHVAVAVDQCGDNEIYDTIKGVCREVICPSYYQYNKNNNSCEAIFSNVFNQMYEIYYRAIITDNNCNTQFCYKQYASAVEFVIKERMQSDLQGLVECERSTTEWYSDGSTRRNSSNFIVIIKITFAKLRSHDHDGYINTLRSLNEVTIRYKETSVTVNLNITSNIELEIDRTIDKLHRMLPIIDDLDCLMRFETISLVSDFFCPRIKLSLDEAVFSGSYFEKPNFNVTYDIGSVIKNGNDYLVCLYPFMNLIHNKTVTRDILVEDSVEEILSLICSLVSIVSLVITLFIYSVFKKLRTIPGINNMMLSLHLLAAHSFYLFGFNATWNDKLCSALGLLTHYFWLASVLWMHICTVHMFRVFFIMKMKPTVKQSKRVLVVYSLYAAIISGLLVSSNITYYLTSDHNKQTTGYLGYGGDKCYITITNMVLFTFAIPVGILLVSNIAMFCLVIYKIENLPEVNSNNRKDRNMFIIYAKLTCLTGITWIFGFIYEWIQVSALSYTFILFNASQGLFIFLSFCCNDRVRSMIYFKCRGSDTHESLKQSGSTAVSTI